MHLTINWHIHISRSILSFIIKHRKLEITGNSNSRLTRTKSQVPSTSSKRGSTVSDSNCHFIFLWWLEVSWHLLSGIGYLWKYYSRITGEYRCIFEFIDIVCLKRINPMSYHKPWFLNRIYIHKLIKIHEDYT